jgi:uncharacterized protein
MLPSSQPIRLQSSRTSTNSKSSLGPKKSETTNSVSDHKPEFLELLESIAPKNREETRDIHDLWRELPSIERDLIDNRSSSNLERYKNQVKALLLAIINTNTKVKIQYTAIRGTSAKKEFSHIQVLDDKLKLLAETISHPQNSAFQILKSLDNIKGFLLDIQR